MDVLSMIRSTKGKFFVVEFEKKDGSLRRLVGRLGVRKGVTGEGMKYDPQDYGLQTVYDVQKKGFRHVNLRTVSYFKCGAQEARL